MAKKKVAPKKTDGVLIRTAMTIGRAAGKLAALVTPEENVPDGETPRTQRKVRASTAKPRRTRKASTADATSKKKRQTVSKIKK